MKKEMDSGLVRNERISDKHCSRNRGAVMYIVSHSLAGQACPDHNCVDYAQSRCIHNSDAVYLRD